ncbi:MAG: hypothetical protein KAX39_02065 [candidate division Zixibacteria bacterium]|nr:hypothetical protein [candidate division Zixibacteria bacterium]
MHFIFGYTREVPVKIEREASKLALVGLAILIVLLFIFLTFEDIDEEIRASDLIFRAPSNSIQIAGADNAFEIDSETLWIHPERFILKEI